MLRQEPAAAGVKRCIGSDNIYAARSRLICPNGTPCCWQRRRRTLTRACIASTLASTLMHSCECVASAVWSWSTRELVTAAEKAEEGLAAMVRLK